jgi:hypothetical protein
MASRTRLREEIARTRAEFDGALAYDPGDPRAAQLIESARQRMDEVADGGGEPDERTPAQQARHDRIVAEVKEVLFPESPDEPVAHLTASTGTFRRPIDPSMPGVPLREGGLLASMGIRESTADVGRIDGNTRSTGALDNLPLITSQEQFFAALRMYDRGAGDAMGSSQGALREHIIERGPRARPQRQPPRALAGQRVKWSTHLPGGHPQRGATVRRRSRPRSLHGGRRDRGADSRDREAGGGAAGGNGNPRRGHLRWRRHRPWSCRRTAKT